MSFKYKTDPYKMESNTQILCKKKISYWQRIRSTGCGGVSSQIHKYTNTKKYCRQQSGYLQRIWWTLDRLWRSPPGISLSSRHQQTLFSHFLFFSSGFFILKSDQMQMCQCQCNCLTLQCHTITLEVLSVNSGMLTHSQIRTYNKLKILTTAGASMKLKSSKKEIDIDIGHPE